MGTDKMVKRLPCEIIGYLGLPGAGKTYSMCYDIKRFIKEYPGITVYSNIELNLPNVNLCIMKDWQDLFWAENGLVVIDEVNLWLPSRAWKQMPAELLWKLAQVRKFNLRVLYTAQHIKRVDTVLRELTFWIYQSQSFRRLGFFLQRQFDAVSGKAFGFRIVPFRKNICDIYDTRQFVNVPSYIKTHGLLDKFYGGVDNV